MRTDSTEKLTDDQISTCVESAGHIVGVVCSVMFDEAEAEAVSAKIGDEVLSSSVHSGMSRLDMRIILCKFMERCIDVLDGFE